MKLPETLLSLYRNSDAIYLAKFDKIEDAEVLENTEERTVVRTKQHFDISTTLKGESRKLFVLEEDVYRYKPTEVAADSAGEDAAEQAEPSEEIDIFGRPTLKAGDPVILFLKTSDEGTLRLTDYRDAIKKMSQERIDVYEARIRELNSIFSSEKVDDSAIVDWLVNCAKDPITRWEGAYELQRSFERLAWQKERDREEAEEAKKAEAAEETEAAANDSEKVEQEVVESEAAESDDFDTSVYAKLLTASQKEVLTNLVLESEAKESETGSEASISRAAGDQALLEVVLNWGDTRLARLLVDRMQNGNAEAYLVSEWMQKAAAILHDDELTGIASRYAEVYYQEDDEVVETESERSTETSGDAASEETTESTDKNAATEIAVPSSDVASLQTDDAQAKVTYKQLRAELVGKFLDRSAEVIADAETRAAQTATR